MARKKKVEVTIDENVVAEKEIEVEETKVEEPTQPTSKQYKVVAKGGLRIRKERNLECEVIDVVPYETIVTGIDEDIAFITVEKGYMLKDFLEEV